MKKIVLVDIDGTISRVGDRLKYLEAGDWDAFYAACGEDEPIPEMVRLVQILMSYYEVVFCTGRTEAVRYKTWEWLYDRFNAYLLGCSILMRKEGDHRHDIEVKPELLKEAGIDLDQIAFVLEDRNSMVKKWREMGLRCLQVAEGDF
jgi:hypothetical protein